MIKALILSGSVLAVSPFDVDSEGITAEGIRYPLSVIAGYAIVDAPDEVQGGWSYAEGVFSPPPAPPPVVPQSVTMRQARLALLGAGLLATVSAAVAAMPGAQGDAARIEWEFSSEVKRGQPLVAALAPVLGMTDAQLDQLFIAAAAL